MKAVSLMVLALPLLNVVGTHQSTSVKNNADQNGIPNIKIMDPVYTGSRKQRFRREINCEPGQFRTDDLKRCCKKCEAGNFLAEVCTDNQKTICKPCPKGEFSDAEHSLSECHRCRQCQEQNGQEKKTSCNATHNTKCTCMKNFFCPTNENCEHCNRCKKCNEETEMMTQPCTETTQTICTEKESKSWVAGVVVSVAVIVLAAIVGVILYRKKSLTCQRISSLFCSDKGNPNDGVAEQSELIPVNSQAKAQVSDVPDFNLSEEHLHLIVEEIEPKIYHKLGIKLGLTEPKLQQIEADHRDDTKRQGYAILYSWFQGHGKQGAFPHLIGVLRNIEYITTAENIMRRMSSTEVPITCTPKLDKCGNGKAADSVPVP
uniref:tumor necrosis factor receptor superfamily member 6-like isoform X2 n=1 Tax=Pristiophorus japonicus TaxID=55135 RepID=UPI00398EC529